MSGMSCGEKTGKLEKSNRRASQLAALDGGQRVLGRPTAERDDAHGLGPPADLVFVQVHAALSALTDEIDARATSEQRPHRVLQPAGDAARSERLDHHPGIPVQDVEKRGREIGRQLDEQNVRVDVPHEAWRAVALRRVRQPHAPSSVDYARERRADRSECVRFERMALCGVWAVDDLSVQHRQHADAVRRRDAACVEKVAGRVRTRRAHGQHRAGQHHGAVDVPQHMVQQRGGIGKRVRAVGNDKAVVPASVFPDRPRHLHTVRGGQVGGVQPHQLAHRDRADRLQRGQQADKRPAGQGRGQPVCRFTARDCAAGGDQKHLFH